MGEVLVKAKETMNAKTRVRRTFNHEKTDRVTIGYAANPGIHQRLIPWLYIYSRPSFIWYRCRSD